MRRLSLLLVVLLVALSSTVAFAQDAPTATLGPVTQAIVDRGQLNCAVNNALPGFGFPNAAGEIEGFDADFCRAVAAAVLGDATAVNFRPTVAADRQTVLQSGEVDMISRNTTATLSRDTLWGATFAPTTFYDGQGVMVMTDSGAASLEDLAGGIICTNAGTTTELNITDAMRNRGLDFDLQTFQDFNAVMATFLQGGCDAVTTDMSGLVSQKASAADPGALTIIDLVISKEPLGPMSAQSDPQFADILRWTVFATFQAEEFGITSANIDEYVQAEGEADEDYNARVGADISRFLGYGGNQSGSYLGIDNHFTEAIIRQVGNYGEIFERNLGADTIFGLARGVNALWTNGGLLYSPPFR
ncbi:MAG: amino acid ABC transporter substrate-binding protein [Chloroflexota bacterium]